MLRSALRSSVARASLILLGSAVIAANGGLVPSPAQAAVFTDLSLPTITGTAVEGQTLTEVHASWSAPPAAYAYQWNRCDSSGNHCESIEKAKTRTYGLTAADVGFTIRVTENARDAEGAVTPSVSEPTAVIKAQAGSEHKGGSGGGGGGVPPVSCCEKPTRVSSAEIRNSLARQLAPSGKTASISALLEHRGLHMSFTLPEAGSLVVQWYFVPRGAKLARKTGVKPILVAAGRATFTTARTRSVSISLTAQGRKLLRHAKKIHLEAKGIFTANGQAAVSTAIAFVLKR